VVAHARQVVESHALQLEHGLLLGRRQVLQVGVVAGVVRSAAQIVVPVGAALDVHGLARDQGDGPGGDLVVRFGGLDQVQVLVGPRFVVIVDDRQVGVVEDVQQALLLAGGAQLELAVLVLDPTALERLLVFPLAGITRAGLGFDVVPPHVFRALAVGPDVLAGDGTGVAPDALVQVERH